MPALSTLNPWRFPYDVKRSMGTNVIGSNWNGRMCCAVMRVARRVGGTGDSERNG